MSGHLKPCPFCGSDPVYRSNGGYNAEIRCDQCRQAVVKADWYGGDLGTTEAAWNKRTARRYTCAHCGEMYDDADGHPMCMPGDY